ncbi:hypothetical protein [Brevundimonas sp. G8]|uniref:hypothetical protein n=1 Tax=Brevundimonas sp. G8 TaxID=1350776 RepID=UPI0012F1601C|nr:hypothetical protein [Brevundimonas sp. G8]VXB98661.1 conserved hypothetical protein [Brevundimonas sp. G8]
MQTQAHLKVVAGTPVVFGSESIIAQLETARALIESRFSDAGLRLAGSLDMVGRLIESLDRLGVTLNAATVSQTTEELLSTADGLNALPAAQEGRVGYLTKLRSASGTLEAHIDEMRTTLRYLRAFALNVKITAGGTIRASDEFAGFAERMCDQLDLGVSQLDDLGEEIRSLTARLEGAKAFELGLGGKYKTLIPSVPNRLAVDAEAIQSHHSRIVKVAGSVAAIARDIQLKVGKALMALQIGDITRQRIEHVQLGLEVTAKMQREADLSEEGRDRAERRLLHLLADQMADIATDFETEAAKVMKGLAGMAQDTAQILIVHDLVDASGQGGGLRGLENSLGDAGILVEDVTAAMANAHRISSGTVSAVEALTHRVDAIQRVKRDIQQMAINSSLRCNRLGEIGKPLSVIAIELSSHAGHLEEAADQTLGSLKTLSDLASDMDVSTHKDDKVDAVRLNAVRGRLRQAADVVEHDLAGLGSHSEATAQSLSSAIDQLSLKEDLGDALNAVALALAEAAGPAVDDMTDILDVVHEAIGEIGRCYTMARERTIHAAHAVADATEDAPKRVMAATDATEEFDDILF